MAGRQVAQRYARALFDLTGEQNDRTPVANDLAGIATLIDESALLNDFLRHPLLDISRQQATLKALFESRIHATTLRFLLFLSQRQRLAELPAICEAFAALDAEARGVVSAVITAAQPISAEQVASIVAPLETRYGKQLITTTETDASLLGGFVVKVGDTVHDFSVLGKLRALKRHIGGV